jgi:hypothetical protein
MYKLVLCVKCDVFVLHLELQSKHTLGGSQQSNNNNNNNILNELQGY